MVDRTTRPIVPAAHPNAAEHRRLIADRANAGLPKHLSLTVAELTGEYAASLWAAASIYVSDETGGAVLAFSDGTNWRRVTDRAVVS